jgi:hypothetical protein
VGRDDRHRSIAPSPPGSSPPPPPGVLALASPAVPALVDPSGVMYPPPRRSMDIEHRERLLRRIPVSLLDMEISRRYYPPGLSFAGGTDVPGAQGVGARRGIVARMGDRRYLRPEVMTA